MQSLFAGLGDVGSHAKELMRVKRTTNRWFEQSYWWSLPSAGQSQTSRASQAFIQLENVQAEISGLRRVAQAELPRPNGSQTRNFYQILNKLLLEIEIHDETLALLGLKGGNDVNL